MQTNIIYNGDSLATLRKLTSESIQTCVTSPPYFGLRDYGTAKWEGGDAECDHSPRRNYTDGSKQSTQKGCSRDKTGGDCRKCGARRIDNQIGLEHTPDAYVAKLVEVFREVRRVLKNDGTLWLNLGDSYTANYGRGGKGNTGGAQSIDKRQLSGLKPKDLIGIPWRAAFALQADGWYLRSDIIWAKGNPMPESVRDRPTKAHEYLFLLSKSGRYLYDSDAINEPVAADTHARYERGRSNSHKWADGGPGNQTLAKTLSRMPRSEKRNKRSVWNVNTKPFKAAHFAVMPEALVEPCILAGSKPGDLVLDPFSGAGTVAAVAKANNRRYIGIDLNPDYCQIARDRIAKVSAKSLLQAA